MKKWDVRLQADVKLGDKCPCHGLYILDGAMEAAETYKLVELCPDALFDYLFAFFRDREPEASAERMAMALNLRDV